MKAIVAAGISAALLLAASPSAAQVTYGARPAAASDADALGDPALKAPAVLAFMGVRPGWRIADLFAGKFTRAFSQAVGAKGKVYAIEFAQLVKAHPAALTRANAVASRAINGNVEVQTPPIDAPALPANLDAVFIRQNYHDLHDKWTGPADVGLFNRNVYAALKPGGIFVIIDHAAAAGTGLRDTDTLHRIDPAAVKAEVTAAGFVFDGSSDALANPADDHTKAVFDPSIRGRTDQFIYRFRKPKA
ncbi:MAG: class I SAM-dependent methyltransferase [Caulobacteraceae bacterium]|nr:class I SAM-dependent methyltransferase [Caulobacter sp.]